MALIRFFLILFNVAVVTFLIYRMLMVAKEPSPASRKAIIIIGGLILLIAPFGMFIGIFGAGIQYFMIYPVAISLFLFLTKQVEL